MRYSSRHSEPIHLFFRKHKRLGLSILLCLIVVAILLLCAAYIYLFEDNNNPGNSSSPIDINYILEDSKLTPSVIDSAEDVGIIGSSNGSTSVSLDDCAGEYNITHGGDYILSGRLTGRITIDAPDENVHLILDNAQIESTYGPAILCIHADKLVITSAFDSENSVSDSGDYRNLTNTDAAITCNCDLTFNGSGKLTIFGYYKDAVHSADIVKVISGQYNIKSKRNGILARDGILLSDTSMDISSEKDGMCAKTLGAQGKGSIAINNSDLNIIAGRYGINSQKSDIFIADCTPYIKSVLDDFYAGGSLYNTED